MADGYQWDDHQHDAIVHTHGHFHVTHNHRDGGFDHLSSYHEHEHDHAALAHRHPAHEDFDREHEGEAHVHDHGEAVKPARAETAKKAPAKKAASAGKSA